jgi:ketosteroid isomerase-like protein
MVIRVRDGRIISSRDYADPLASVQALGRIPELVSALTEEETGRARVAERLRRTVETMDIGAFAELLAPDAVYEVPFAPPSTPVHIEGREAVMAHLAEAADRGRGLGIEEVSSTVHLGADPELVVIELQVSGTSPVTGRRYRFDSSIGVVRVQKGRIVSWRDHPNASAAEALAG